MANSQLWFMTCGAASSQPDLTVDATKSCTATSGSPVLTMASTGGINDGAVVDGPGVPAGTVVNSHTGATVTCSNNITPGSEPQNRTFANEPGNPWGPTGNVAASDGIVATCSIAINNVNGARSEKFVFSSFTPAAPDGANIVGVGITVERFATQNGVGISDDSLRLRMAGVAVGNELANTGSLGSGAWGTADEINVYGGGDGDTLGVVVEQADTADSGFGFELTIVSSGFDSASETASIDYVELDIYYQVPSTTLLTMGVGAAIAALGAWLWFPGVATQALAIAATMVAAGLWRGRTRKMKMRPSRLTVAHV